MSRRVRIAMLDSGISALTRTSNAPLQGGITIAPTGEEIPGYTDRLGHGTAICALMQELAPQADLYSVRIFDRQLATTISVVLHAIRWCVRQQIDIINLSLGTTNEGHAERFTEVIQEATAANAVLVSAYAANGAVMLPGSMTGVIGVAEDFQLDRQELRFATTSTPHFAACPYALDIPGVARERNLHGVSFSVAHVSARLASLWPWNSPAEVSQALAERMQTAV